QEPFPEHPQSVWPKQKGSPLQPLPLPFAPTSRPGPTNSSNQIPVWLWVKPLEPNRSPIRKSHTPLRSHLRWNEPPYGSTLGWNGELRGPTLKRKRVRLLERAGRSLEIRWNPHSGQNGF